MSVYDITFSNQTSALLPPHKRKVTTLAYLGVFDKYIQYNHDLFFKYYADNLALGDFGYFNNVAVYAKGDRTIDLDQKTYELYDVSKVINLGATYQRPRLNLGAWFLLTNDYRGSKARALFNGQKLTLEYVLNQFFRTTFRQPDSATTPTNSDIYISQLVPISNMFIAEDGLSNGSPVIDGNLFSNEFIININTAAAFTYRTIYVPDSGGSPRPGWWTAFNSAGDGEKKIRAIADKYNIAGCLYNILTY